MWCCNTNRNWYSKWHQFAYTMHYSFVVQVKISFFYSLCINSIDELYKRLHCMNSINNWFLVPGKLQSNRVQLMRLGQPRCPFTIEVMEGMEWLLQLPSGSLSQSLHVLQNMLEKITTQNDLMSILTFLDQCTICKGNADPKFAPIVAQCKGILRTKQVCKFMCYISVLYFIVRKKDQCLLWPAFPYYSPNVLPLASNRFIQAKMPSMCPSTMRTFYVANCNQYWITSSKKVQIQVAT